MTGHLTSNRLAVLADETAALIRASDEAARVSVRHEEEDGEVAA